MAKLLPTAESKAGGEGRAMRPRPFPRQRNRGLGDERRRAGSGPATASRMCAVIDLPEPAPASAGAPSGVREARLRRGRRGHALGALGLGLVAARHAVAMPVDEDDL